MEMEEDDSSTGFSPEVRERIIRSFEAWLDRSIADEQPPQGLTAGLLAALENGDPLPPLESEQTGSRGCDFYSLWAAMTALTQEVRLQGRTFKQLNETLNRSAQSLEASAAEARAGGKDAPAVEAPIHEAEARQPPDHVVSGIRTGIGEERRLIDRYAVLRGIGAKSRRRAKQQRGHGRDLQTHLHAVPQTNCDCQEIGSGSLVLQCAQNAWLPCAMVVDRKYKDRVASTSRGPR